MAREIKNSFIRIPEENIDLLTLQEGVNAYVVIDDTLPRFPESDWFRKKGEVYEKQMEFFLEKLESSIKQIEAQGGKYLGFKEDIVLIKNPEWASIPFPHRIVSVIASKQ